MTYFQILSVQYIRDGQHTHVTEQQVVPSNGRDKRQMFDDFFTQVCSKRSFDERKTGVVFYSCEVMS